MRRIIKVMTRREDVLIKIGNQSQAKKDIFLHKNGSITCGKFIYKGRFINHFKAIYHEIIGYSNKQPVKNIVDVSKYKIWDAVTIYDQYILEHWVKSITSKTIERMAHETIVCRLVDSIKPEFNRALRSKWTKIFVAWKDKDDPNTPRDPWQIL